MVQLSDVAEQCLGKMLDKKKNKGIPMPYLRNPNVRWLDVDTSDLQLMPFEEHELDRFGLEAGDVVICEGGEAGRAAIWDGRLPDLKFQKAIHRVRPGKQLYNRYFVHRLMADYHAGRLSDYYTGTTIKHFTGQDLKRYRFPLPPLSEQKRIAEILDRAESLRRQRRAALALLDELTQSIFLDMFGDAEVKNSHWPVVKIGEYVSEFQGGKSLESVDNEGSINRVLKVSAVTGMKFRPMECKPVPDTYAPPQEHFVKPNDLLFSRANTSELVGAVAYVSDCPPNLLLPDKLWRFVWKNPDTIHPLFIWFLFQSGPVRREIGNRATGTSGSMKNISKAKLNGIPTILPPFAMQTAFADRVESVEKTENHLRNSLVELDQLFASLQHRAFRGEL